MGRSIFVLFTLLKFYFTPKPPTITFPSLPNPILTRPSTTWSIITIKLHQRTHPSSLLHPLETSLRRFKIFASLKPSIFQELFESRETSPFSRTPNFLSPSLLPFFLELISPSSFIIVTVGRVVQRGGLTFSSVSDVFRAFVSSISRFVRDRLRISNRWFPSPCRSRRTFFLQILPLLDFGVFFTPPSGHQFLTTVSTNLTRKVDRSDSFFLFFFSRIFVAFDRSSLLWYFIERWFSLWFFFLN